MHRHRHQGHGRRRRVELVLLGSAVVAVSCGAEKRSAFTTEDGNANADASTSSPIAPGSLGDAAVIDVTDAGCLDQSVTPPPTPMIGAALGPDFASLYRTFDLGQIPGVPSGLDQSLGGVYIKPDEPNTLYVIGDSEKATAALYRIKVKRDLCLHIIGFDGVASLVTKIPFADASLVLGDTGWLYSMFPNAKLGHVGGSGSGSTTAKVTETSLIPLGVQGPFDYKGDQFPGDSPGGLAVVPSYLAVGKGSLIAVAYPSGSFFHLAIDVSAASGVVVAKSATKTVSIPNGPGAFAYVPTGSPGFVSPSLIVTEWFSGAAWKAEFLDPPDGAAQGVAVYEVDSNGDPKPSTRRPFFAQFPRPWGAFFEPLTGDFLFATWRGRQGDKPDRIVQVRGFVAPEQLPSPH